MVKKITKDSIISLFVQDYQKRYYLRELARQLDTSHQRLKPHLDALVAAGVLIQTRRAGVVDYSLQLTDERTLSRVVIAEKERLFQRLEDDTLLRALFEKLSPFFGSHLFVLFGSAVLGLRPGYDIDFFVVGRKSSVAKVLSDFEEVYNRAVHVIFVTDLRKITLALSREIYHKHLIFNQTETVVRHFWERYGKKEYNA